MKIQKRVEVYLLSKRLTAPIDVVQYDTGYQLVFEIADFDIPVGTTASLFAETASGKPLRQTDDISVAGNVITVDPTSTLLSESGEVKYQIRLTNGSDLISTFIGKLNVERSLKF